MIDPYGAWIAVALAVAITSYLSLVLGALRHFSPAKFEELLRDDAERLARLRALLEDEARLVLAVNAMRGIATTVGIVALTAVLTSALSASTDPSFWLRTTWVQAGVLGVVLFVALGHLVPHALGERRAEPVLIRCLESVHVLRLLSLPVLWLFIGLVRLALRTFNVDEERKPEELKHEILDAALAGHDEGVIDDATKEVIENLIEFRDVTVGEVMTKRPDVISVDASDDLQAMTRKALEHQFSRLPVTDKNVDKVVGVLMVKDLFRLALEKKDVADVRTLFRTPIFVPEAKKVADLLKELRAKKTHMAIVADEYGHTAGIVTIEDCIEEIIGEIDDEHDTAEKPPIRRLGEGEADVDAKLRLEQLNEELGTRLPEDADVETVGGFITMRLGKIPVKGDKVAQNGYLFTVTEADERRVRRVHLKLSPPVAAE